MEYGNDLSKRDILNIFNNDLFVETYLETESTTHSYDIHFKNLVDLIPLKEKDRVLDVGTAHGPPSLALFRKQPNLEILAIDPADKILAISKAKFYGEKFDEFIQKYMHNSAVMTYLANQYEECHKFRNRISYGYGFAEDLHEMNLGRFDHVLASLALHWLIDPVKAFSNFHQVLKENGTVAISSASWKYKMSNPELKHEQRIDKSPFIRNFYNNLDELICHHAGQPPSEQIFFWDLEKVNDLLTKTGFKLIAYLEKKVPTSLGRLFIACKSGALHSDEKRVELIDKDNFPELVGKALSKTMAQVNPIESLKNYYEMCPYILAKKI